MTAATASARPLSFYFDPVPDLIRQDIANGFAVGDVVLKDLDAMVMGRCLRQRRPDGCSPGCECTKEQIGASLGRHPRTVQRSSPGSRGSITSTTLRTPATRPGTAWSSRRSSRSASAPRRPRLPPGDSRVSPRETAVSPPPQPYSTHARFETEPRDRATTNSSRVRPGIVVVVS